MSRIIYAIAAPFLRSICNIIDKYLVSKFFNGGIWLVMFFGSLSWAIALPLIYFFLPEVANIPLQQGLLLSLTGIIYLIASVFYFYAIRNEDASLVAALLYISPVFSFLLGWLFLWEMISFLDVFASLLIVWWVLFVSLDHQHNSWRKLKSKTLILWCSSWALFALSMFLFKFFALETSYRISMWRQYIWFVIFCLWWLCIRSYRKEIIWFDRTKGRAIIFNMFNEWINIVAMLASAQATMLAPLFFVSVLSGIQWPIVFLLGIILSSFFPHIMKEDISRKTLIQRAFSLSIILIWVVLLS